MGLQCKRLPGRWQNARYITEGLTVPHFDRRFREPLGSEYEASWDDSAMPRSRPLRGLGGPGLASRSIPGGSSTLRRQPAPPVVFLPLGRRLIVIVPLYRGILLRLQPHCNRHRAHGASTQARMLANLSVDLCQQAGRQRDGYSCT